MAAVIVSVVHVSREVAHRFYTLDNKSVPGINSFLLGAGVEASPAALRSNYGKSFRGHVVLGMGFTFDDTDLSGVASSLSRMKSLIEANPHSQDRILPYIGGSEINTSPTQSHHRYVINFGDLSQEEAEQWPDLIAVVREKVLPERARLGGYSVAEKRNERWWQFGIFRG
ncbi:MAG: hypothetical protein ACLQU5_19430 [Isosphaeraceae bacterium]